MKTDVKYRFSIVNFSKSDSLYNCGMKPVRVFCSLQFRSYLIILLLLLHSGLFRCCTRKSRPIVTLWVGRGLATTSAITRMIRSRQAFSSSSQIFPILSMLNKKQWQHAKTTLVVGSRNNWTFCSIAAHAKCLKKLLWISKIDKNAWIARSGRGGGSLLHTHLHSLLPSQPGYGQFWTNITIILTVQRLLSQSFNVILFYLQVYLAHCFPYRYSDLAEDLARYFYITINPHCPKYDDSYIIPNISRMIFKTQAKNESVVLIWIGRHGKELATVLPKYCRLHSFLSANTALEMPLHWPWSPPVTFAQSKTQKSMISLNTAS